MSSPYEHMPCGVWIEDADGRIVDANSAALRILGLDRSEAIGAGTADTADPGVDITDLAGQPLGEDRPSTVARRELRPVSNATIRVKLPGSEPKYLQVDSVPVLGADGRLDRVITTFLDVSERVNAEREARDSEGRFRAIFDHAAFAIARVGLDARLLEANPALCEMLGYRPEELAGVSVWELAHPADIEADTFSEVAEGRRDSIQADVRWMRRDGSVLWGATTATVVRDSAGEPRFVVGLVEDISARREHEAMLRSQVLYDALTSLPNRVLFQDRLQQALLAARRDQQPVAVMVVDLDDFRLVNDDYGHAAGDDILRQVATRIRGELRASDTVARLGSDEFAIILPTSGELSSAILSARKLEETLSVPYDTGEAKVEFGVSIGISFFPEHGDEAEPLMRRADVAMRVAKRDATGVNVYQATKDDHGPSRLAMITELRHGILNDELDVHYQPQVDVRTGRVVAAEALVRWRRSDELIEPAHFLHIAEQSGLIRPLSHRVLEAAIAQARRWDRAGTPVPIAVNLSTRNLHDPELPQTVRALLDRYGVRPALLKIEVTETSLMADPARVLTVLGPLSEMGVRVAVDDFGTGYSSLAYLRRLPVDEIKIDRSFVSEMNLEDEAAVIVRSTIDLGHNLGLLVAAEGVETRAVWDMLGRFGCDLAQGYLLGRPAPATGAMATPTSLPIPSLPSD